MKKTLIIAFCVSAAISCSNPANSGSEKTDSAATTKAAAAPTTADEKGLELIGSSDCTTCHRLQKEASGAAIGPAYSDVAAKYAPAADTTIDRLVKKVITGGSGVWGSVPMTPHPALAEADARTIVKYIMTLKK